MKQLWAKVAEKQEGLFLIGFLILYSLHSIGMGVTDQKWLAGIGIVFLGVKILITKYTVREMVIAAIMGIASLIVLILNTDKMLLLTVITIIAIKNCDYRKIFLWCIVSRSILMSGKILLILMGVLPNTYSEGLTKYSILTNETVIVDAPAFGFGHPNFLYLGAVAVGLLLVIVYHHKLHWYGCIVISLPLVGLYEVTYCRTGLYLWVCILLLLGIYQITKWIGIRSGFMKLTMLISPLLLVASVVISELTRIDNYWGNRINWQFSGRFTASRWQHTHQVYEMIAPQTPWLKLDDGYIYAIYNYGWIIAILLIGWSVYSMYLWAKQGQDYYVLGIAAFMGYWLGEAMAISTTWNPAVLLLAVGLYQNQTAVEAETKEKKHAENTAHVNGVGKEM